ncbi:phage exclusion protein Lit family protein [Flavobacterium aestivum]|uniref:phage exclusion protein Lit family protein n=1 Tax=Flavobacterium aestivum TaxID=3003257 RepID=UPI0024823AA8|nr:phage exclusion protein Lit family protein [Flavobacterium aestivum]
MNINHKIVLIKVYFLEQKNFVKCCFNKFILNKKTFYNPESHVGDLPIRVLQHNITYWLEIVSPEFYKTLLNEIQNNGLQRGIKYHIDKQKILHVASVNAASISSARQISTYETFNSYLWCICYALLVTFDEIIQKPHLKGNYTGLIDKKNKQVNAAIAVFKYGMSLRDNYSDWDKSIPNPEEFDCKYTYYVERANSLFTSAMFFILSHEVGHNYFNHVTYNPATAAQSLQEELDADNFALEQVLSCQNKDLIPTLKHGAVAGMCALLFLSPKLYKGGTYPDADNRIRNVMEKLNLKDLDLQWGMASLAFRLWGNYFKIDFETSKTSENYSEMFYEILSEMNKIKKT